MSGVYVHKCTVTIIIIINNVGSTPSLSSWISRLSLTEHDYKVLTSGQWLSAHHMAAINHLLEKQFPFQHGLQDTHLLQVKCVWRSFPHEFVQIVYLPDFSHWVCVSNIGCDDGYVDLYDSMITVPKEDDSVVQQVCTMLKSQNNMVIHINVVDVQQQIRGNDCGAFVAAVATDLCHDMDPSTVHYLQDEMRPHMKTCFLNEKMSRFPSVNRTVKTRVRETVDILIYCICRQPEGVKQMVCCDGCNRWYHSDCVVIGGTNLETEEEWYCSSCEYLYLLMNIVPVRL